MPPTTRFSKWMKKDIDPSHSSSTSRLEPYPIISMMQPDPPLQIPEETSSSIDIDAFMNQPGHATIVNAIIDRNKETIMENFLRDNVGAFEFGRPPPIDISDPTHLLFGWQPPSVGSSILNDPFSSLNTWYQRPQIEPVDPNIPSTQVSATIPQNTHPILTQPLVHTTSQPTPSVSSASVSTPHFPTPENPPFTSNNTAFSLPPHETSCPFTTQIPPLGSNTSSFIPPNITINPFVTSQSSSTAFPLGPWNIATT